MIPQEATSLVFASKHVSASGKLALTVHATGNPYPRSIVRWKSRAALVCRSLGNYESSGYFER
ncbi:hypothetical protein E6H32_09690 [Candidatus Bathyarchaeota archaeon]|nr:MAG: hypothetical protein E6H32_09690 [Candidatus Bathyarchaeota archaeon]